MPRIRLSLKKLLKPEADYISLVPRSANQIPFRIQKHDEETNMPLDLSSIHRLPKNLTRVMKGEPAPVSKPHVSAIVVRKGDDLEAVKEQITKAGFKTDKSHESEDGHVVFTQTEDKPEEGAIFRLSDEVIVVTKGYEAHKDSLEAFSKAIGVEGYYESLNSATNALRTLVTKSATPKDIEASTALFNGYAVAVTQVLPKEALALNEAVLVTKAAPAPVVPAPVVEETKTEITPPAPEPVVKADPAPVVEPVVTPVVPAPVVEAAPVVVTKADLDALAEKITALTTMVEQVQKASAEKLDALTKDNETLKTAVAESIKKADLVTETVKSTVLAPPPVGDPAGRGTEAVKKADHPLDGESTGFFDSAFHKRSKR